MKHGHRLLAIVLILTVMVVVSSARAGDCTPSWQAAMSPPLKSGSAFAFADFNDGNGKRLAVGSTGWNGVTAWDGERWEQLGAGYTYGEVRALAVFDDGSGPQLYAGGNFTQIAGVAASCLARWDGSAWHEVPPPQGGSFGSISALCVYDAGAGPELFVGGEGVYWNGYYGLLAFDGAAWSVPGNFYGKVRAMVVHNDQAGESLYLGGTFDLHPNNEWCRNLARWNAQGLTPVSNEVNGDVYALAVTEVTGAACLAVGGQFQFSADGGTHSNLAFWTGTQWTGPESGHGLGVVRCITDLFQAGSHSLWVGGLQGTNSAASWDGVNWTRYYGYTANGYGANTYAVHVATDKQGKSVFAGGDFDRFDSMPGGDTVTGPVARITKGTVHAVGQGLDGPVVDSIVFDDGSGPKTYAAGYFVRGDGRKLNGIARWNGLNWEPVGEGLGASASCLAIYNAGDGPRLYAGIDAGYQGPGIARWNGKSWQLFGTNGSVRCMRVYKDGGGDGLFVGGTFYNAGGITFTQYIARFDGQDWSPLADGMDGAVNTLAVYDSGSGPRLIAAGFFNHAGQISATNIAAWNGTKWFKLSAGLGGEVLSLAVFEEESGDRLFAGGRFVYANDNVMCNRLARWNGSSWTPVGDWTYGGQSDSVNALVVHNDGSGAALYLGGVFEKILKAPMHGVARWDGLAFASIPNVLTASVVGLATVPNGDSNDLWVGGSVTIADDNAPAPLRILAGCSTGPCYADFNSDGVLDLFDFLGFVNLFNASDDQADCDASGHFDLFDFLCFTNAFNSGCP